MGIFLSLFVPYLMRWLDDFLELLARNHAVGANETQHPGDHLIGAGPVVAVHCDDFGALRLADATIQAQMHPRSSLFAALVSIDSITQRDWTVVA